MAHQKTLESLVGAGCILLGLGIAAGATQISGEAGYGGVGPNFLPWLVGIVLMLCGVGLVWQAQRGGWKNRDAPEGALTGDWLPFAWVSAGIVLNALLITHIGFILSCTLCFVLAVRGFHLSQMRLDLSLRAWVKDSLIGFCIAGPVYWMFTKLLAINLPDRKSVV